MLPPIQTGLIVLTELYGASAYWFDVTAHLNVAGILNLNVEQAAPAHLGALFAHKAGARKEPVSHHECGQRSGAAN